MRSHRIFYLWGFISKSSYVEETTSKASFWFFNEEPEIKSDLKMKLEQQSDGLDELVRVDYILAHNIIHGALEYAEDHG